MGFNTRRDAVPRRCCLVGATLLFSAWSGRNGVQTAFGFGCSPSSIGRSLAAAAAGGPTSKRRPRASAVQEFRKPSVTIVGEGPSLVSSYKTWRDLSPEEEWELCNQIAENRRVQDLQLDLERSEKRPVTVQEWAVAAGHASAHQLMAAMQEGRKAERTMVLCHKGLVQSVARRYIKMSRSLSPEDLVQEGTVGLLQAVNHFDPTKGARFSSYAVFRIKASILRAVADKDRLVRVPVHAQDAAMRIIASSHTLQVETGSVPTDAQLALAVGISEKNVSLYRKSAMRNRVEDMSDPVVMEGASEGAARGGGRIHGERWPWGTPSRSAQADVVRRDIMRIMQACLSPTEERVLRLRFGLGGEAGSRSSAGGGRGAADLLTFKEIGRMMELSAEGIRQMVFRSIAKLQASDEANGLLLAYADLV